MKRVGRHKLAAFLESASMTIADHKLRDFKEGFDVASPDKYLSLIDRLESVARGVEGASRDGEGDDDPEGTVTVAMSHTFAEGLSLLLREAAMTLKRPY